MEHRFDRIRYLAEHPLGFTLQVLRAFRANQGFLLAGAVAYNTLLSAVPMMAVILVGLSQVVDRSLLEATLSQYLSLLAPGEAEELMAQVVVFLENWQLVGAVGVLVVLFFSSLAFTVLESAMAVIFVHRARTRQRHPLVSAVLPFAYILMLAMGLLVVTLVTGGLHALDDKQVELWGYTLSSAGPVAATVYLMGVLGELLLLTSLYLVMPVGRLEARHALVGGVTATLLWEISRHVMVWYFETLSLVNVVYGTFTTAVVILLSLEVAALILLLGAQVIAVYERLGEDDSTEPPPAGPFCGLGG